MTAEHHPRVVEMARFLGMAPADVAVMLPDEMGARVEGRQSLIKWWADTIERICHGVAPDAELAELLRRLAASPDPLDYERLAVYRLMNRPVPPA